MHYSISSEQYAGLPGWLSFYQRNSSTVGILYGTPTRRDLGRLDVRAIAINTDTFDSLTVTVSFNVIEYVAQSGKLVIFVNAVSANQPVVSISVYMHDTCLLLL